MAREALQKQQRSLSEDALRVLHRNTHALGWSRIGAEGVTLPAGAHAVIRVGANPVNVTVGGCTLLLRRHSIVTVAPRRRDTDIDGEGAAIAAVERIEPEPE